MRIVCGCGREFVSIRALGVHRTRAKHEQEKNNRRHPLYEMWKGMRARCFNPSHESFGNYGGRGIRPAREWDDFRVFAQWAGQSGYHPGLLLDRIDNNGGYSPDNCRWVSAKIQANNTRKNIRIKAFGETKTIAQWAEDPRCAVPGNTVYQRLELGWPAERALSLPSQRLSTQLPITFAAYQAAAAATAEYPGQGMVGGLCYAALGLAGECGEIANKVKKILRDDAGVLSADKRTELVAELSDVLWYIAAVATELGIDLGRIAENNLDKLHSRAVRGVLKGSGDKR